MQDYLEELLDQPLLIDDQDIECDFEVDDYLDECVEV